MAVVTGDPELDFFEQNPIMKSIGGFKQLKEENEPALASKIAWSIFMIEDLDESKNPLARMPREQRIEEVRENYYPIDMDEWKSLLDIYGRLVLSKEQNMFKIHWDKMDELTAYLKQLHLDDELEFNKYMRIMKELPKMWDGLEKVKTKMIESQNKTTLRGGAKQSAREKRRK